ncbi:MAG: kelch repeat-containing protein, partial [Candidatus Lutacidiplasmatales archaeon]
MTTAGPSASTPWFALLVVLAMLALAFPLPTGSTHVPAPPTGVAPSPAHVFPSVVAPTGGAPVPAAHLRTFSFGWLQGYIFYSPPDPPNYLFGLGTVSAVDNPLKNTTWFGGQGYGGLSNVTLSYDNGTPQGCQCWWYPNVPHGLTPRSNSSFGTYTAGGFMVLFGGVTNLGTNAVTNQTWLFWVANQTWQNVTKAQAPPGRENAAFAVDEQDGFALLQGGIDPSYRSGGVTGTVIWNDSWELNLTTLNWTLLAPSGSPPALYASSMIWSTVGDEFVLNGGCSIDFCSGLTWYYSPVTSSWSQLQVTGAVPSARGSSSFVWDPVDNVSILFGGFQLGTAGLVPLGDSYTLDPATRDWEAVSATGGPNASYGAASAFADYPGCIGMWVIGGSPTITQGPPGNASLLVPSSTPGGLDCYGVFSGGGPPPQPCSNDNGSVSVLVRDAATRLPIPNATLNVQGSCGQSVLTTDKTGHVSITERSPDVVNITTSSPGYHSSHEQFSLTGRAGQRFTIELTRLPTASVRVFSLSTVAGLSPLGGASVVLGGVVVLGTTDALGWVNSSALNSASSTPILTASAPGHSSSSQSIVVPYTGVVYANATLLSDGGLDIRVVDNATGGPVANSSGMLTIVEATGGNSSNFLPDALGWYNVSLPQGNYSVSATAPGYFPNSTKSPVFLPWLATQTVDINLTLVYGADVHVYARDANVSGPVPNASVTFGRALPMITDRHGWANASDILPPGKLGIKVEAWGYYPNRTVVLITYFLVLPRLVINLTPAPPCSGYADCPPKTNNTNGPPAFALLPPPG